MSQQHLPQRRRMQQGATPGNNIRQGDLLIDRFLRRRNELSERQKNAVELLLQGLSDQEVAAHVRADRSTIFRWRKLTAFVGELDRQRQLRAERAANQLQSMVPSALKILQQQLESEDDRERLRAVSILLRFATPGRLASAARATPAEKAAHSETQQHMNDLIDFVEAPLPGEPGAPETMEGELPEEDEDEYDAK
jgi:transposase